MILQLKGYDEFIEFEEFLETMDDSTKLRQLEKIHLSNIEKGISEVDYQLIFEIIRNLNTQLETKDYLNLKTDKKSLLETLLRNQFKDCGIEVISKKFRDYIIKIMITYLDMDAPIFIDKFCSFEEKYECDVEEYARKQVMDGVFENRIFEEVN